MDKTISNRLQVVQDLKDLKYEAKVFICNLEYLNDDARAFWLNDIEGCTSLEALKMTVIQCCENLGVEAPGWSK